MKANHIFFSIAAIAILSFTFFGFTQKSESENGILTMRVIDAYDKKSCFIVIVNEKDESERVVMESINRSEDMNTALINTKLNEIASKGYKLIGTSNGGSTQIFISTYIFQKK